MLTHLLSPPQKPPRAVVLGAGGFVGAACVRHLKKARVETLPLSRSEVDLLSPGAARTLKGHLRPGDTLVFASAKAPCKSAAMLVENLRMAEAVCSAVGDSGIEHVVYISSDAVYRDSAEPITESSCAEPGSLHGAMHLSREVLLRSEFAGPLAILRPTLIYGLDDPHNGYGPNRFRRLASSGKGIVLFGDGEERRDHVHIEDVAEFICLMVLRRSTGTLNAVSGAVASFRELAEFTASQFSPVVSVSGSPRTGPMPHNGYRPFDAAAIERAFPGFRMTAWKAGIVSACKIQRESKTA